MTLFGLSVWAFIGIVIAAGVGLSLLVALCFRVVVPTNSVHIVQTTKARTSYGGKNNRNTYYSWPSWLPLIGVRTTVLPLSVFDKKLVDYAAYDVDRVPFKIDIVAFFRISDSDMAAERVLSFTDMMDQLEPILQGAARTILATSTIDEILGSRAVFGSKFTEEVMKDLLSWGVEPVKSIELMDIRDAEGSKVIANIMAKKQSYIEMESRTAVATNARLAQTAEIESQREVLMRKQEAEETVGMRTAQKTQAVGISDQKALQAVQEEVKNSAEKEMAVTQVKQVRAAEIAKQVQTVLAEQMKATSVIKAEGDRQMGIVVAEGQKQQAILNAEGALASATMAAQGIEAKGKAEGAAETAKLLAPVTAQTELAQKIGENLGYQEYLVRIRTVERDQAIGVAQAGALTQADVKIIVQSGSPAEGAKSVLDLFTPRGATQVAAAVEAARNASQSVSDIIDGATGKPDGGGRSA